VQKDSSRKVKVIENGAYTVWLEQLGSYTFIHLDMHTKYSLGIKKRMQTQLQLLMAMRKNAIHALNDPRDQKHKKYLDLMGFRFSQEILGDDKRLKEVWIKQQQR